MTAVAAGPVSMILARATSPPELTAARRVAAGADRCGLRPGR